MTKHDQCELDLCGEKLVDNPSLEALAQLIREFAGRDDFFAVLAKESQYFMQTSGSQETGKFAIEVREGSDDHHRQCIDTALPLDTVIDAMTAYLLGNDRWRTDLQWKRIAM